MQRHTIERTAVRIEPGFHENGTSFSIPDYQASDFTQFRREGSCTENLTVVDSTGSTYYKQITVYVVDTTAVAVEPEGTTRSSTSIIIPSRRQTVVWQQIPSG